METGGQTPEKKQFFRFENNKLIEDLNRVLDYENIDEYESEKLEYLSTTFSNVVKQLNKINKYCKKADELWIKVKKDFNFVHIYKAFFDTSMCKEPVDWKDFCDKLDKYERDLENAIGMYHFNKRKK